jgi:hypothetical protein
MINKEKKFLIFIMLVSIISRGLTLFSPELWSDETNVGLMGLRVMGGEFPVLFPGQSFMGSLESFLASSLFQFIGPSSLTLELLPVILSILFLVLLFLLSKTFFDYKTALITIALLSIPPLFLMRWSHEARPHYPLAILFGNFLLLITHQLLYREMTPKVKSFLFMLLGLLAGIGWWTNYLIVAYILPVGFFLFLGNKKILFSKNILFLIFMFLVGSLPLWIFNISHHFPVFGITNAGEASNIIPYLREFFINAFPILLGFLPPLNIDHVDLAGYLIIVPIFFTAIIYYIFRSRQTIKSFFFLRLPKPIGGEILLLVFFVIISLNLLTNYGSRLSDNDQKYLLPLYTCLPIFVSVLLIEIRKKNKILFFFLLGLIVFSNLVGNLRHDGWTIFNLKKYQDFQKNEEIEGRLINFLTQKGYNHFYSGPMGKVLTFKSQERLICADRYQEVLLKYADLVDSSNNPAYLCRGEEKVFESNIKAIGGSYRKVTATDGYLLYADFKPPPWNDNRILRNLWKGTSNLHPGDAKKVFDGDISTGWGTRGPQKKEDYFLLDLGRVEIVEKVSYIPASYREVPAGYQLSVSLDGKNWQIVSNVPDYYGPTFWSGPNPMTKVRHGRVETVFPPQPCRFLHIRLLQGSDNPWSINEIFLFGPADEKGDIKSRIPDKPEIDHLLTFLKGQKIRFAYADHWLSAVIRVKSDWKIRTIISNFFTGDNGENEPRAEDIERAYLDKKVALVVGKEDLDLEKLLRESKHPYLKKEIGPFVVYYGFSNPEISPPLSSKNWEVSSNSNPQDARKAIDRNPATRWTSGKPQEPGIYYQIDLKKVQLVKGYSLFLGESFNDYPRSLKLFSSLDGNSWEEIKTAPELGLYWTGETFLKMTENRFCFSPVKMRYLRLLQEGRDPVYYWSIHELELF